MVLCTVLVLDWLPYSKIYESCFKPPFPQTTPAQSANLLETLETLKAKGTCSVTLTDLPKIKGSTV